MASSAPGVSVGLTLAALAATTAYAAGPVIILTAIPMLVIANAYRRLNMWLRREALRHIPGAAGRNSEGGSWVRWLT